MNRVNPFDEITGPPPTRTTATSLTATRSPSITNATRDPTDPPPSYESLPNIPSGAAELQRFFRDSLARMAEEDANTTVIRGLPFTGI